MSRKRPDLRPAAQNSPTAEQGVAVAVLPSTPSVAQLPLAPPARWLALLGVCACFLLLISFQWHEIFSTDLGWQLRTGEWIVQHRAVPYEDQLAFTTRPPYTTKPLAWVEARWLFCVTQYLLWSAGEALGIGGATVSTLSATVVLSALFFILAWPSRRLLATPLGLFIVALTIWTGAARFVTRPELVSYFFIAVYLVLLERRSRLCRALPILQIIWTNAHGLFIFGPIVAWMFAICGEVQRLVTGAGPQGRRSFDGPQFAIAGLVTLVCLFNPYGIEGLKFPFLLLTELQGTHSFGTRISEFLSPLRKWPWLWSWDIRASLLLAPLALLSCVLNLRWSTLPRALMVVATTGLAALSVRNVTLFALVSCWALLRNTQELLAGPAGDRSAAASAPPSAAQRPMTPWRAMLGGTHLALLGLIFFAAWFVASGRFAQANAMSAHFGFGVTPWLHGQDAIAFLREARPKGNVYHHILEGGWLAWADKGENYPVFVDGRLEVYGPDGVMAEYFDTTIKSWPTLFDKYKINVAILDQERMAQIASAVFESGQWTLVHIDPRKTVFVRNIPEHAELIAKYGIDPRKPYTPRTPEPSERTTGWRAVLGDVTPPRRSLGMAATFLALGGVSNAERYLEAAVADAPDGFEARAYLAALRRFQGNNAEADRLLAGITVPEATERQCEGLIAGLLVEAGRRPEAIPHFRRALEITPLDVNLRLLYAECFLVQADRLAHPDPATPGQEMSAEQRKAAEAALRSAAENYRLFLAQRPQEVIVWQNLAQVYEGLAEWETALQTYQHALRLRGDEPRLYNQMGICAGMMGKKDAARAYFEKALALKPDYAKARENLRVLDKAASAPPP